MLKVVSERIKNNNNLFSKWWFNDDLLLVEYLKEKNLQQIQETNSSVSENGWLENVNLTNQQINDHKSSPKTGQQINGLIQLFPCTMDAFGPCQHGICTTIAFSWMWMLNQPFAVAVWGAYPFETPKMLIHIIIFKYII